MMKGIKSRYRCSPQSENTVKKSASVWTSQGMNALYIVRSMVLSLRARRISEKVLITNVAACNFRLSSLYDVQQFPLGIILQRFV